MWDSPLVRCLLRSIGGASCWDALCSEALLEGGGCIPASSECPALLKRGLSRLPLGCPLDSSLAGEPSC